MDNMPHHNTSEYGKLKIQCSVFCIKEKTS